MHEEVIQALRTGATAALEGTSDRENHYVSVKATDILRLCGAIDDARKQAAPVVPAAAAPAVPAGKGFADAS